jgi:type VII secretion-associated serine protease mycosin
MQRTRVWPAVVTVATVVAAGWAAPAVAASSPRVARAETLREAQWFLDAVHAPDAQAVTKGAGVTVAVIDSGVDATHPDLAGAILPGVSFNSPSQAGRTDPAGHGTRMAGVIAARGGSVDKALGIAPAASILPIAIPATGQIPSLAEPVRYAVEHGAKVINLSIARPPTDPLPAGEAEAIEDAVARGVVVVVAVGNKDVISSSSALAALPGVIVVSGIARSGTASSLSLPGKTVALAAPAENIVTASPKAMFPSGYAQASGTSEGTAVVSGVAALVRAKFPELDVANVVNRLVKSAVDKGPAGRDDTYGFGLVDAQRALTMDIPAVTANPLGDPAGGPAPGASRTNDGGGLVIDEGPKLNPAVLVVCLVLALLVVAVVVGLVIWLVRRGKRRPPPGPGGPPFQPQYQQPQYPQPQYPPPQYPPSPGQYQQPPPPPPYPQPPPQYPPAPRR